MYVFQIHKELKEVQSAPAQTNVSYSWSVVNVKAVTIVIILWAYFLDTYVDLDSQTHIIYSVF